MLLQQQIIQFIIIGTILFLLVALFMVSFLFLYRKRQQSFAREKTAMQDAFQRELLQSQLEIQETTLQNIAQEIHDNIGQTLSLAKLNLNTLDPAKPNWEDKTRTSKELVSKAIQDLRSLSKTMYSEAVLASGLCKAVAHELSLLQASGASHTSLQINGEPERLPPQTELILFRIVQEALHNIIKHAKATLVSVKIWADENTLYVLIADNGVGFDIALQNNGVDGGAGLRNMLNRARLIGGECKLHSAPEKGTQIELYIPYKTAP